MSALPIRNPKPLAYRTAGGVRVRRVATAIPVDSALDGALTKLNTHRGAVLASGYEYPGRYSRWDLAFVDPPVEIVARRREFEINALGDRGVQLLGIIGEALRGRDYLASLRVTAKSIRGTVIPMPHFFPEEARSKQPTIFSVLRTIINLFYSAEDSHLGLYGAMGYDLVFQFEPIELKHPRDPEAADLHLFIPDEIIVVDHRKEIALRYEYEFRKGKFSTEGLESGAKGRRLKRGKPGPVRSDHKPGEYARKVGEIIEGCRKGDFFEVVPSQVLSAGYAGTPRELFENIRTSNPSPYEFLINLGREQLIGASPEMFIRVEPISEGGEAGKQSVEGRVQVESCPIAGTIRRGASPLDDADAILELLNSEKDKAELTMCTDVDRNDKSRVCKPGSVRVIDRRMIEKYSRLFHTVDHVVGELRDGYDGLDALLSHMWACTLTGSPKPAAMQKIEDLENSPRQWYGGCIGILHFNRNVNTGITIRTVHLRDGTARVRVGATILYDSDPREEELETRTKAEAFINAVLGKTGSTQRAPFQVPQTGRRREVLFVDNADSFVHTLANYVRQTGAEVTTVRAGFDHSVLDEYDPDLVFISPGPGRPSEFGVPGLVKACVDRGIPVFGVCLGLQGMVEAFGGKLGVMKRPMHGKMSRIQCKREGIFAGFPAEFEAGRYHSIYAIEGKIPDCLEVLARTEDGVVMAVAHRHYPAAAVQFHPESILSLRDDLGLRLIAQVVKLLAIGRRSSRSKAAKKRARKK